MTHVPRSVIIESPSVNDMPEVVEYARQCIRHSFSRGEAPISLPMQYLLHGDVFRAYTNEKEHAHAQQCGRAMRSGMDCTIFYEDLGWSKSMLATRQFCELMRYPFEVRTIIPPKIYKKDEQTKLMDMFVLAGPGSP